jgi:hypothetical protein
MLVDIDDVVLDFVVSDL